jgi:hypothetical protein
MRKLKKYDPEKEQALRNEIEQAGGLEKNDLKAMIIAAILTIFPVVVVIFILFVLFAWLFV